MKYADVIIENKSEETDNFFTYGCRDDIPAVGQKVFVPFGRRNKIIAAYVFRVFDGQEGLIRGLKYIDALDPDIILTAEMLETAQFIKRRFMCKTIDGLKCFLPAGNAPKKARKPYRPEADEAQDIRELTAEQQHALSVITPYIERNEHNIFLLQGVTGSGKTEVYMRAIQKCLDKGKNAIMLVPEISLTKQVIERFLARFGQENTAIMHSKIAAGQRYDEWMRIKNGGAKIVIGARSAVFAPLEHIGIIIMDEEHETSYKSDKTPKYDTLDVAIKRLKAFNGILILGSATPSVVSAYRAEEGIYTKVKMEQRYNYAPLPTVKTVDMRKELLAGNRSIISGALHEEISSCLENKQQIILFLNRRGYAPFISCQQCGYAMRCPECGITMTYHKSAARVICHYCGLSASLPEKCPECAESQIRYTGVGTEMLEETISELYQDASLARLDLDTVSRKGSIEAILNSFKKGKTDILIGTQLVAKGLDFKHVGLVGVISADSSLNIPDFRSAERTFQLITQAAGRAGRGDKLGKVIIQTFVPDHYAVQTAANQDYEAFYKIEKQIREALSYPPYGELIQAVVSAGDEEAAQECANIIYMHLTKMAGREAGNFLPPCKSPLVKAGGKYRYQIIIKCPKGKRNLYTAALIGAKKETAVAFKKKKAVLAFDVNPYSFI